MTPCNIETLVLNQLLVSRPYTTKVLPHLKAAYFTGLYGPIFRTIAAHAAQYKSLPPRQTLEVELEKQRGRDISENDFAAVLVLLPDLFDATTPYDEAWLYAQTEAWVRQRALEIAILQGADIIDGRDKKQPPEAIPSLVADALAISFNSSVGHAYIEDVAERYDLYHREHVRIPFDIDALNRITSGGVAAKTLNVFMGATGGGKSLVMCHIAASMLMQGRAVLYITLEMAEEKIAERIDANLLNVPIDQIPHLPKSILLKRVGDIGGRTQGRLIIKEYPTGAAHADHFRALLSDLKLKSQFVPDVIVVDYLNICASARVRAIGGSIGSYNFIKAIAEELRGLAVEAGAVLITATQVNRAGYANKEFGLEHTSESFGLPATADLMLAIESNPQLEDEGAIMLKQLKNRYASTTSNTRVKVGIDRVHMRLTNMDDYTVSDRRGGTDYTAPGTYNDITDIF